MRIRCMTVGLLGLLASTGAIAAAEEGDPKMVSGMSILGNNETPKSLYIVPWKTSEIASETALDSSLDEKLVPVDKPVFMRELDFYRISSAGQ